MGNLEHARDLGQGIYTQSESDSLIDGLASIAASNVLLSGTVAVDAFAVTKSNANKTYTGNGSTQSITTGIASVDFTVSSNGSGFYHDRSAGDCIVKNDAGTVIESGECVVNTSKVHIKSRSLAQSNIIGDGLRGIGNGIQSNATATEDLYGRPCSTYTTTGFTIGSDIMVNGSGIAYIAHQTLYTHIKWGLTSQGKRYLQAYNPVTREVMTMYQGSGIAGHQIPNALGIKLDYFEVKNLDTTNEWYVDASGNYLHYDTSSAYDATAFYTRTDEYIELKAHHNGWNGNDQTHISYGFANSETKVILPYTGTGASGNFIETVDVNGVARKPRRVIIKRTDGVSEWHLHDTARDDESNNDSRLWLSTSSSEANNVNYKIEIKANGFNIANSVSNTVTNSDNASGGQYIAIVEFDTTGTNDDTYFDLPTDDTNLNVTGGQFASTDGIGANGYNQSITSYTGSIDFAGCNDGINWVGLDTSNVPYFFDKKPSLGGMYEKTSADDNRLVLQDGKLWNTTGGELVTNGTFDSDISGWTSSNAIWVNGLIKNIRLAGVSSTTQAIDTVVGETYVIKFNLTEGDRTGGIRVDSSSGLVLYSENNPTGTYNLSFVAQDVSSVLQLFTSNGDGYCYFDNISVYKLEPTLGTEHTPVSFLPYPYQVASGTPMDELVDVEPLSENVVKSLTVQEDLEVGGDVSIDGTFVTKGGIEVVVVDDNYIDLDAIGGNPQAKLYSDGTIVGSTDYGSYVKYPNGELECSDIQTTLTTSSTLSNYFGSSSGTAYYVNHSFVYPIEFMSVSSLDVSGGGVSIGFTSPTSLIGDTVTVYNRLNSTRIVSYTAKGRWKS